MSRFKRHRHNRLVDAAARLGDLVRDARAPVPEADPELEKFHLGTDLGVALVDDKAARVGFIYTLCAIRDLDEAQGVVE